jgi:hypothetical protein
VTLGGLSTDYRSHLIVEDELTDRVTREAKSVRSIELIQQQQYYPLLKTPTVSTRQQAAMGGSTPPALLMWAAQRN